MKVYTKRQLISKLKEIKSMGWIKNTRPGNVGGIGNTLEDLLGIQENNLPIPNAAEWELKCRRDGTSSLTTLLHMEPSPRALRFVPKVLLPLYGWKHELAGTRYPKNEMSFRQTINGVNRTDRGFGISLDMDSKKILLSFNYNEVDSRHQKWLKSVKKRIGLNELDPQPYWGFKDLEHKLGTKLLNCFYVKAAVKKEKGHESFFYKTIFKLEGFNFSKFLTSITQGNVLVDIDARTGHNHGTKFRMKQDTLKQLYDDVEEIT